MIGAGTPIRRGMNGVGSIRSVATDEFGDLLDHLFLNAGIAVLGKCTAWIGRHRMTMLKTAACLVDGRYQREQRRRAGGWTERAVVVLVPDDQGRNRDARRIEVERRLSAEGQDRHRRRQDHA